MLVLIYLDNAATTKANLDVIDSFVKVNQSLYYNPNSPHYAGLQAAQILQQAKKQVTQIMNCPQFDVLFTSGATESNNIALKGIAYRKRDTANVIITSVLEHPSVLEVMRSLEQEGFTLKYVNVTSQGIIDVEHLKQLMSEDVGLVTCMHVNNIMGQIQPIQAIVDLLKHYPKAHFHVDAVQAFGKIPLLIEGINSMSLSGHKFNGLKGQGLLLIDNVRKLTPIIQGGGQEYGVRSGTVNLPMDVSLVKALKLANEHLLSRYEKFASFKQQIVDMLKNYPGVYLNSPENAAPHIVNIAFPGVKGEVLVNAFSKLDVMVSTTSACSSKREKLNEVLLAMGLSDKRIEGSIRISFGDTTSQEDIDTFKKAFNEIYGEVKELLK